MSAPPGTLLHVRRGEVYEYVPVLARPGQSRARLIISSQPVNDADHPAVLGLHIVDRDPGGLLSVGVGGLGWAAVMTIEAVLRSRLGPLLHTCTSEELDAVSNALRAAQDL